MIKDIDFANEKLTELDLITFINVNIAKKLEGKLVTMIDNILAITSDDVAMLYNLEVLSANLNVLRDYIEKYSNPTFFVFNEFKLSLN